MVSVPKVPSFVFTVCHALCCSDWVGASCPLFLLLVCCWTSLVYISEQLLHSSALWSLYIFSLLHFHCIQLFFPPWICLAFLLLLLSALIRLFTYLWPFKVCFFWGFILHSFIWSVFLPVGVFILLDSVLVSVHLMTHSPFSVLKHWPCI